MITNYDNWKHFLHESKFILFSRDFDEGKFRRLKFFYWQIKSLIFENRS